MSSVIRGFSGSSVYTGERGARIPGTPGASQELLSPGYKSINDEYLAWIEQYKGTQYYDLLKNNPFLLHENDYTPSWWERTIEQGLFDDYSRQNNFFSDKRQALYEEAYKILGSKAADDINSPLNKVSKDKLAGLNPDLVGTQTPDSAISPGTDETSPSHPDSVDSDKAMSFVTSVSQLGPTFVQQLFNYGRMFGELRGQSLDNAMKDFVVNSKAYDVVLDQIAGADSFVVGSDGEEIKVDHEPDSNEEFDTLQDTLTSSFGKSLTTRRAKQLHKYMTGVLTHDKNNKKSLAYQRRRAEKVADFVAFQTKAVQGAGRFGFDEDFDKFLDAFSTKFGELMDSVLEHSLKFQDDYNKLRSGTKAANADNAADDLNFEHDTATYEGESLGAATGQAEIADAQKAKAINTFYTAIEGDFKSLETFLSSPDMKGKWYTSVLKFLLPYGKALIIRMFNSSFGINFNRASSSGPKGASMSSDMSGGFSF